PYLAMIDHATTRIDVENAYPLATDVADALASAARRGVQVRFITGAHEGILGIAARTGFQKLLDAGVHIYVYPTMVHTKALAVDGKISTLGSANVDDVALTRNREIISVIEDPVETQKLVAAVFD